MPISLRQINNTQVHVHNTSQINICRDMFHPLIGKTPNYLFDKCVLN